MLRVALAQINVTVGDLEGNCARILSAVRQAKEAGADIVVVPELAVCGYPPEDLLLKDHFVQDNIRAVRGLARQIRGLTAVIGFVDRDRGRRIYNAAAVLAAGRIQGVYHKQELPNYGVFDEKRYFTPGREVPLFILNGIRLGVSICEDIWTDSVVHRQHRARKAQVILNLSSSPYDFGKLRHREQILMRQARQSRAYVCYTNLVGGQDELVFDGSSLVVTPQGRRLAQAQQFAEDLLLVDLPVEAAPSARPASGDVVLPVSPRRVSRPLIPARPAQDYCPLGRVWQALVLGTRDYVRKNGFQKVVLGLSGGIDSALVAAIACQSVGQENVIGVSMPSPFSSAGTRTDAQRLAHNLGIRFIEMTITPILRSYQDTLAEAFAGLAEDITEENIQARIRGNLLMALSNKFGWLVLTTGNKSEVAVGYCTLYGDMTGGFAVIKDVPKTQVFELARYANDQLGPVIPESILTRAPSAELRPDQTDQDALPAYADLDPVLKAYVEQHQSLRKIPAISGDPDLTRRVINLVDHSEYKRRQSPPGIKISPRAFGKDWRLPITNKYRERPDAPPAG